MERVTISLDDGLLEAFDAYIGRKGYANRSEAIRDLLRAKLDADNVAENRATHAVGCLSYVFDHHQRELVRRLTHTQHDHHELLLSTLHVHLDHDNCLEVTLLRGPTGGVRALAETIMAETGVRHGNLHLVTIEPSAADHSAHAHAHTHDETA
ncbi:MAG: nickel-responsive transcriptional regulator NikR [Rhodospirillaceae bacterium]|nr:nickel-responsive transcriptional regulator NikR [Rhodospirillaceae bacterium]MEA4836765.1 nickel-responsive transcriptional regulator NikR [Rhodospirillaceae bacterium]